MLRLANVSHALFYRSHIKLKQNITISETERKRGKAKTNVPTIPILASAKNVAKRKQTFPLFPYGHRRRKRGKAKTNVPTIPIPASAKETWQSENKRSHYSHTGIGEGNVAKRKQTFPLFPYWHRRRKRVT